MLKEYKNKQAVGANAPGRLDGQVLAALGMQSSYALLACAQPAVTYAYSTVRPTIVQLL